MQHPPPRAWYTNADHFRLEMAQVFGRSWLVACHGGEIAEPGSYLATRSGGQEIVVLRDRDGDIRAFHNVCRHRAHRLLDGSGTLKAVITCPYHAWSYGLDGSLRAAPRMEAIAGFDRADFPLSPVRTALFAGFVMVCHDDAAPEPGERFGGLEARLLADHPNLPTMRPVRRREALLKANWKTIIENYLECYHCDIAHPSFGNFDLTTWKHLAGDGWSRQGRVATDRAEVGHDDIEGLSAWWQWPNVFWARAKGADTFVVAHHEPLAPGLTRQIRVVYAADGREDDELRAFNDLFDDVFAEDISVVESVQRGLSSRGYRGGALIAEPHAAAGWSEHAVGRFQDLVRDASDGAAA